MTPEPSALIEAARAARTHAYAPYSGFAVGAVIATEDGELVSGANFENASYGLSVCAEAVALAAANARGLLGRATAIAIVGDAIDKPLGAVVTPCGRCRQMLLEAEHIAGRPITLYCAPVSGQDGDGIVSYALADLLPHAFGPGSL
jgi:cytidine deaminase